MPAKLFCLTLPKKIVQEPFSVSLISGIEKFYALEGYVTIFYRIFLSDSAEISVGKPFIVSLISGIEKVWIRGGGGVVVSRFSVENFLSQSAENFCGGNIVCCVSQSFQERQSLWIRGGEESIKVSVENFSSHSSENFRRGILLCCVSENFR